MLNYPRSDILITTARVALFFTLLFSYPVLLHPTRAAINRLLVYLYNLSAAWVAKWRKGRGGNKNVQKGEGDIDDDDEVESDGMPLLPKTASITSDAEVCVCVCMCICVHACYCWLSLYVYMYTSDFRFLCRCGFVRHGCCFPSPSSRPVSSLM